MDTENNIINTKKNKHLNIQERTFIEIRLKDGWSAYKIAKALNRAINTVLNEIKRGSVKQIKNGEEVLRYFADAGLRVYENNRNRCKSKYKILKCVEFINYVNKRVIEDNWSVDACFGEAMASNRFRRDEVVCSKTLYNYIDMGLIKIKNSDLPMKLRLNKHKNMVRTNKRKLGRSIEERESSIETREEFGHWEIDTVIGSKNKSGGALLTLIERKTLKSIHRKLSSKTAAAVDEALANIKSEYAEKFDTIFKTITSDNGSEFANLSNLEKECDTKVYFTHPYSSFEKGCNERHNGLIRRFIPKKTSIFDYSVDEIFFVEDWLNTLPRKKLNYSTPDSLFDQYLDVIYSI